MQFSIATIAALVAVASATYVPSHNTTAPYPTGTGSPVVSGTAAPTAPAPTVGFSQIPFPGAASEVKAGSALAIVIAGGVAMFI